jgi:hypothetical protein
MEDVAAKHPIPDAHSIHEIVLHVITWLTLATGALRGEPIPEWPFPEDWPPTSDTEWWSSVERLKRSTDDLVEAAGGLSDDALSGTVPGRDFDTYFLLHGIAQHNGYHGGQIALLKKPAG